MIDPTTDDLIPLNDVRKIVPVHRSTLARWSSDGIDGVVLETVWIGKLRFTTRAAVAEFVAACTEARKPVEPEPRRKPARRVRRTRDREAEIAAAEAKLREFGVG